MVNKRRGYNSKAELQIARLLEREGVAYNYEHSLAVVDKGRVRIWYPDFYLPEYGVIIEYFGVNGDSNYDERTRHKIEVYKKSEIDGLFLNKTSLKGDWPAKIIGGIENILKSRLERFYNR